MKRISLLIISIASAAISTGAFADAYTIDAGHSAVTFETGHVGISRLPGRFNEFSGSYDFDAAKPANTKVSFEINVASIDTNHADRDKHLTSPDFFDAKQYPKITFTSTSYKGTADKGVLTGDMTLHGVTKPVAFELVKTGEGKDPWGGYRQGFIATTKLLRSEFGVTYFIPGVPDETDLKVFIEGVKQ